MRVATEAPFTRQSESALNAVPSDLAQRACVHRISSLLSGADTGNRKPPPPCHPGVKNHFEDRLEEGTAAHHVERHLRGATEETRTHRAALLE